MRPRKNQTFSHHQNIWIVTTMENSSPTALKREFREHFKLSPRQLPRSYAFSRVINKFMPSGDVSPSKLPGPLRTKIIEENINTVRILVEELLLLLLYTRLKGLKSLQNRSEVQGEHLVWTVRHRDPMHEVCIPHSITRAWKQQG